MVVTNISNYGFMNLSIMIIYELLYSLKKNIENKYFTMSHN